MFENYIDVTDAFKMLYVHPETVKCLISLLDKGMPRSARQMQP